MSEGPYWRIKILGARKVNHLKFDGLRGWGQGKRKSYFMCLRLQRAKGVSFNHEGCQSSGKQD